MHYDVIVAGAGPAGSIAATALARKKYSVLLLEKKEHPRHKSCGGGISARLSPFLDPDFKSIIENEITTVQIRYRKKKASFSSKNPFAYLVRRCVFDSYLSRRAAEAGAEVCEATPLKSWDKTKTGVFVESRRGKDTAKYLIAADGANSQIARTLYPEWEKHRAPSLEEAFQPSPKMDSKSILLELSVPKGYGWMFPKMQEAAVGIGIFRGKPGEVRNVYRDFLNQNKMAGYTSKPCGAVLPLFKKNNPPLNKGPVLLTGDAAALIDPFFGEGIYYGVRSGQLAAEAIDASLSYQKPIEGYQKEIATRFYPEFIAASEIANWVYLFPGLFLEIALHYPRLIQWYIQVFQGEMGYDEFWKRCKKRAFQKFNPFTRFFEASSRS